MTVNGRTTKVQIKNLYIGLSVDHAHKTELIFDNSFLPPSYGLSELSVGKELGKPNTKPNNLRDQS